MKEGERRYAWKRLNSDLSFIQVDTDVHLLNAASVFQIVSPPKDKAFSRLHLATSPNGYLNIGVERVCLMRKIDPNHDHDNIKRKVPQETKKKRQSTKVDNKRHTLNIENKIKTSTNDTLLI